jgi:hypothetical protein
MSNSYESLEDFHEISCENVTNVLDKLTTSSSSFSSSSSTSISAAGSPSSPVTSVRIEQNVSDTVVSNISSNNISLSFENVRLREKVAALSAELITVKAKCSALQLDNARLKLALSAASSFRTQGGRSRSNTGGSPVGGTSNSQVSNSSSSVALQQLASTNSFYTKTGSGKEIEGGSISSGLPRPPSNSSFLFGLSRDRSDTTESVSISGSYRDRGNTFESEKLSVSNADCGRGRASSLESIQQNHPNMSPSSSFTPSASPEPHITSLPIQATEKQAPVSVASSMLRMPSISFSKMWVPSRQVPEQIKEVTKSSSLETEKELVKNESLSSQENITDQMINQTDESSAHIVVDLDSEQILNQLSETIDEKNNAQEDSESSSSSSAHPSPPSHKVTLSSFISGESISNESDSISSVSSVSNSNATTSTSSFSFRFFGASSGTSNATQQTLTVDVGTGGGNAIKQQDGVSSAWGLFGVGSSKSSTPMNINDPNYTTSTSSSIASAHSSSVASANSSSSIWTTLLSSVSLTRRQRFPVNAALLKLPSWSRKRSSSVISFSKGIENDRVSLARSLFDLQDDHECETIAASACKIVFVYSGDQLPHCEGFKVLTGSIVEVMNKISTPIKCHTIITTGGDTSRFLATSDSLCLIALSRKRRNQITALVTKARDLVLQAPRHDPANILMRVNKAISVVTSTEMYLATLRRYSDILNSIPTPHQVTSESESSLLRQSVSDFSREVGIYLNGIFYPLGSCLAFSSFVETLGSTLLKDRKETPFFRVFMRKLLIASSRTITGGDSLRLVQENLSSKNCLTFLAAEAGGPAELITIPSLDNTDEEECFKVHLSANNNFRIIADATCLDKMSPGSQTSGILALLRCTLSERMEMSNVTCRLSNSFEDLKNDSNDETSLVVLKTEESKDTTTLLDRLLISEDEYRLINNEKESKERTLNLDFVFV